MRKRRNWSKRLLASVLSAAMVALNISTAAPALAAPSAEEYREDAELINDLALPKPLQQKLEGKATSSDAAAKTEEKVDLLAGSARWGTPSNAAKVLHTQLDGVEISVSAPAGVLPEGATLRARKLTEEEEKEALAKIADHAEATGKTATTQFLCDLTVLNAAGEAIQPDNAKGALAVSFRNVSIVSADASQMGEDSENQDASGVSVLHIDEEKEKVDTLREGLDENLPILQAKAEHFSPFAVVNYQTTDPTLGISFKLLDYDGNTARTSYKLGDVTINDSAATGVTSVNFEVDQGGINTLPATGTAAPGKTYHAITDILTPHKFYQIIFSAPLTAAETKAFIENNLKFTLTAAGASQQLKIKLGNGANNLPSGNVTITKKTIPNPVAGDSAEHYYMYVDAPSISWVDSYNKAKSYKLDGMTGYLATITSHDEDVGLDAITGVGAWSGGARFDGINDAASIPAWHDGSAATRPSGIYDNYMHAGNVGTGTWNRWRWQDGPETGHEYFNAVTGTAMNGSYLRWGPYQPDSASQGSDGYEAVMQVHFGGNWNDLPNVHSIVQGYFVEFSGYNKDPGSHTSSEQPSLSTDHKVKATLGGNDYYFNDADAAIAWSQQNGNAPITLIGDTTLTQTVPAGITIDLNGHTLTVPSGHNVTNNGTINATNPASNLAVQGSNGTITNGTGGQITRNITIKMNDRTVTATEPLTWALSDATITGGFIGTDRVSALMVNFDNSSTAQAHPTLPVTAENPTTFDNGTVGSAPLGTYTITYLPGTVTRNPHHYTVKFVANAPAGQTATGTMPDRTITGSTPVNLTNLFALNGYTFNGWTGSDGQTYADGATPTDLVLTNNGVITMTANWTENQYDIHYHMNVTAGSRTASLAVNPNTAAHYKVTDPNITLAAPTWPGYTFGGWYDNPAFTGTAQTQLTTSENPARNRDYYAKWTPKTYSISYDLHDSTPAGHPATNPDSGFTTYTVETPNHTFGTPIRPGYTFLGWYTDAGYTTPAPATLDTTQGDTNPTQLHAKWSAPLPYTITYVMNDAVPAGHPATNAAANPGGFQVTDPVIMLRQPTRPGYDFQGWYSDAALTTPVGTINPASATNHTVYAKWSAAKTYTVQWTLNDGTPAGHPAANPNTISSYTVEDADVAIAPATRTGYNFLGWFTDAALTNPAPATLHTMDAENKHYYAKWDSTPISYPVNYVLNDTPTTPATNPAVNLTSYTVETLPSPITVAQPLRNGYTFLGWYDNAAFTGAPVTQFSPMDAAPKTFYAKWSNANSYPVNFHLNDAAPAGHPASNPNTVTSYTVLDSDIAIAPATRTGYDFEGWYDNPGFTGTAVTTLHTADAAAKDYYAKWSAPKTYTVQWDLNDGTPAGHAASNPNTVTSYTVLDHDTAIAPATRTGYDFLGWYDNPGFTGAPVTNLHTMDAENKHYYAKWSAAKSYTVQWDMNDSVPAGTSGTNPNTVTSYTVEDPDIAIAAPTRSGYTFLGWFDNPTFMGSPVTNLHTMDAADKHYYARWSNPNDYQIYYHAHDTAAHPATNPNTVTSYNILSSDFTLAPASRTGYNFEGWYADAAYTTPVTGLRVQDLEDKNFHMKWSPAIVYPITYVMNDKPTSPASAVTPTSYTVEDADFALGIPTRNGATFQGWYDNAAFSGSPVTTLHTMDAAPKTYYAKWQLTNYNVNYNLNPGGGIGTPTNPTNNVPTFTVEDDVPLAPPVRRGYTGSWTSNGQTVTSIPAGTAGNQTITASWTPNHYAINYDLGETRNSPIQGLNNLPTSYTIEDQTITLPTPSRVGYTFVRWEKSSAPGVADNQITAESDGEVSFKAVWEPIRYHITYDTAGGVNNAANPTTFTIEDEINPYGAVKQGVRFWTWQVVGGKFLNTIPAGTTHDVALVAVYQKDQDTDNVGGGGGGGGAGGGGGTRNGGHRANISPNNVAPLPANNAKPSEPTSDNKPAMSEPTPQKNADRQGDSKLADKNGGKKPSAAQGNVLQGRKRRLPKTGEAPLALNYAGLALGMLLAGFAVAKKKEER
ncbi:hypothetical protein HMPREF9623_00340 [Stomatobaculum longum]|uniref:Bacterial repeat domain-containing protein n=2 Tax=Stomatobaculum longum TaxID=796942 RepID=A0AA36Y6R8_9FIRM|nr:InlB B-repeat-containing protein [Stomatobaculum longum]EHO18156.1 hypothetical protein HMPREF9623_00340 [Stomatobaculum longum]